MFSQLFDTGTDSGMMDYWETNSWMSQGHMADFWPYAPWIMLIGGFLYLLVILLIANYIHKDAITRNLPYPEFWMLIGLILNVFGIILYLVLRDNYPETPESTQPPETKPNEGTYRS